jgi:hypothetical protein
MVSTDCSLATPPEGDVEIGAIKETYLWTIEDTGVRCRPLSIRETAVSREPPPPAHINVTRKEGGMCSGHGKVQDNLPHNAIEERY